MSRRLELPSAPRRATRITATRALRLTGLILAGGLALTACSGTVAPAPSSPSSTPDVASPSAAESTTPTPTAPVLVPDGTAEENLPVFTAVVAAVAAGPDSVSGRAYIDALVATGFDKAAMQVTPDQTTIGNPAEAIQFSVRWENQCLIGQVGPATGAPVTAVEPAVGETCLVGNTRAIDW